MHLLTPNKRLSRSAYAAIAAGWAAFLLLLGQFFAPAFLPRPTEVAQAWIDLFPETIGNLVSSLVLNGEAIALAAGISLFLSVVPLFRPLIHAFTLSRFMGLVGVSFVLGIVLTGHELKLSMVVLAISAFYVTGVVEVIGEIPDHLFDYARTLKMGEWRVTYEIVVRSTQAAVWSVIKQNGAIGWIMMVQAENYVRSEGGLGTALLDQQRVLALAKVFALQGTILGVALAQDWLFGQIDALLHPWTAAKRRRG